MSTAKQITANQQNAEKSTGPTSERGKSIVSMNSTKHGILASENLLPWEESTSLLDLERKLTDDLLPKGELEAILVNRMVSLIWRLRRAGKIESAIFLYKHYTKYLERTKAEVRTYIKFESPYPRAIAENEVILNKSKYRAALKKVDDLSSKIDDENVTLGRNFIEQSKALELIHRYETTLERSLFKTLQELQRIQAMRAARTISFPLALEVFEEPK